MDESGKIEGGRKEYFTKEEVYSRDRNGIDHVSQEKGLNKGMEGSKGAVGEGRQYVWLQQRL